MEALLLGWGFGWARVRDLLIPLCLNRRCLTPKLIGSFPLAKLELKLMADLVMG